MGDQHTATPPSTHSRGSGQGPGVFHQAVALLQAEHHITQMAAYEMLVNRAVRAGTSVREIATRVIKDADHRL